MINKEYIELHRRVKNYSVAGLCRELGIAKHTYYGIINNTKSYIKSTTLVKLATTLELDLNTLLGLPLVGENSW